MKKIITQILLISIFIVASLYGIISVATEETALLNGAGIIEDTIKPYSFKSSSYPAITKFPVDDIVFNSSAHYFCIQHGYSYAGDHMDNTLGDGYHVSHTVTKNKWGSGNGHYTSDMRGDLDTSAAFYTTGRGSVVNNSGGRKYNGYKEKTETPTNSPLTNWIYESEDVTFDCEGGDAKASLAFLFACYMSGGSNNTYTRGSYEDDPLQFAVWDSWLNIGNKEANVLKAQGDAYVQYHKDSKNPNVDVVPDAHVGTTLSGSTYSVGPFKMSKYVRAKDYSCPKSDGSAQTLQDAFGGAVDLQGTIIKAEAIVTNGTGAKKAIEFPVPEPDATFYINLNEGDISGYDELYDIRFTYQRIHACANGTKYIGSQYYINFSEESSKRSGCSYSCPSPASGCSASTSPGTTSSPYTGTCTHTWYSGCWTTYDGSCGGCRCPGGHSCDGCKPNGKDKDGNMTYTCPGNHYCGGCECPGTHPVHHHGTFNRTTHTVSYLCSHGHKDCWEFKWQYDGYSGDKAQDAYSGSGVLTNEIKTYTINVAVPLKTNMKIYKYISKVEHRQSGGTNDLTVGDRSGMSSSQKRNDSVKVERGDIVTYTIKIVNSSRFPTAVKVEDTLPTPIKNLRVNNSKVKYRGESGAINPAGWIEVAANNNVTFTIQLDPDAITGTYENRIEFITKNNTAEKMKYTSWGSGSTHGAHTYGNIVNFDTSREEDSDFYTIKEYDITLDKYITEVRHETNGVKTFTGIGRKNIDSEANKKNNPVYAEYGDVVTYKIDIYNTCKPYLNAGAKDRAKEPFWNPDIAYVDVEDTLPKKYSVLSAITSNSTGTLTTSTGKFTYKSVKVPAGGKTTITVTLVVEEHTKGTLEENNAKIKGEARNVNKKDILNHSIKKSTSDWYKINDYNLSLDKFISSYDASMTTFNNGKNFTTEKNTLADRYAMTEEQKQTAPLQVEKDETLVYTIRLVNNATGSGLKYATQVRPTKIQDSMDEGLTFQSVKATIKKADGKNKYSYDIPVTWKNIGNNTYTFDIPNKKGSEYLILDPGEYIDYEVTVKVTKTNMYLYSLKNTGSMIILTDINNDSKSREVKNDNYNENIAGAQVSSEYVKLKDLVIAGKVWLDRDKDGYMGKNANGNLEVGGNAIKVETNPSTNITDTTGKEYAMQGIVVKLYTSDGTLVRTTKTDSNGLFTFARAEDGTTYYANEYSATASGVVESEQRIPKATEKDANKNYTSNSKLISYYVEYEYDGLVYKSTEIYSDNSNLDNEGGIKSDNKYKIDSNAYEFKDVRENFNKNYEIIAFNKSSKGDLSDEQALEYDKQNHNSYIRENNSRIITARSFITKDSNTSINNTKCLWLYKQTTKDDKPETEYLKYINLGLEEREDVDISITQDVYEVKTTINGEKMTYEYNQNNNTLGNSKLDKEQEKDVSGNETEYSKSFNSERFITGYKDDTSSVENNRELYNFEYYLEDYNYRVSQYHTETVRAYKGSSDRNFNAEAVNDANSILLANSVGRESELNTEVTFRIKVTNNSITDDEPFKSEKDIKVYTGINEIVEYYDKDFVNLTFNEDGSLKGFNVKTKDSNGYLINQEIKVVSAVAVMKDGSEKAVTLSHNSKYNATRTLENYDTLYITPTVENTYSNTLTGQGIKAGDLILAEGESLDILITFVVEKEIENPDTKEIETILGAKENVAEISAYSTYYKDGNNYKSASLIDKDSNPGNFGESYGGVSNVDSKEYIKYFEDDTFKTGITFRVPAPSPDSEERYKNNVQRTLTGFVWDDARTNEAKDENGTQYIGDGTYDTSKTAIEDAKKNISVSNNEEKDTKVKDVKTQLVEIIRMPDPENSSVERIYEDTIYVNGEDSIMETRTLSDGTYRLSGYIPGEYIVRFIYGDDSSKDNMLIFNGQDYKSTSYQTGEAVYAENATASGDKAASDVTLEILEHSGNSDAKDDEIKRLEVIGYSETMTNERNKVLRGINSTDKTALISNTSMKAETPDFLVRTEKEIKKVTVLKFFEHNKKITETITEARFAINNIDFGLQYRPELQVALNNYLSNIIVTTSDESGVGEKPLIDAVFDAYYGIVKNTDVTTGVTSFITGTDGEIVTVDPAAPNANIENAITTAGARISDAQKNNDGTYVLALAGTRLNTEKSVGLNNVQYLPNEYYTEADGSPKVEEVDGKYLVKASQGFAYIVIDDNIMQGATIKVKYLLSGSNFSEIDRVSSNLSDIRFKENRETEKYAKIGGSLEQYYEEVAYQVSAENQKPTLINQNYSAAMTARNALFSEYYRYELDGETIKKDINGQNNVIYAVKAKEMPVDGKVVKIADVTNPHDGSDGYYGRYLGSTYYTGAINNAMEVIAELKLDKIIDYVDNDLVFNDSDNKGRNGLWKTTTSTELYENKWIAADVFAAIDMTGAIIGNSAEFAGEYKNKLVDSEGREYDTDVRSNLALSLDDRVRDDYAAGETDPTINEDISKFLMPRYSKSLDSYGTITITASKVLSPEDKSDDMTYENIAEIIQYTSVTGRVTNLATTIGNAKIEEIGRNSAESPEFYEGRTESDTASVEKITLTPPTGLSKVDQVVRNVVEGASSVVFVIITVVLVCVIVAAVIHFYHRRRIK